MTRSAIIRRIGVTKPDALLAAEEEGRQLLYNFCRAKHGNQSLLIRSTGLLGATVSRMTNGQTPINLEAALLMDVATGCNLPAEKLCPSRADLIAQFLQQRSTKETNQDA